MSIIEVSHLRKEYPNIVPLKDVSFFVNKGDVISIIGPSGTGKSTLIRSLNMLDRPTSGQIVYRGQDITARGVNLYDIRKKIGMVFQSFNLFPHKTVLENIMMAPMDINGLSEKEAKERAMELLDMVGLLSKAHNYPNQLSGGQKQRIAIARTLAMDPEVILFDEPTSALDPSMVGEVTNIIKKIAHSGATMLIVTHEMKFARNVANRVFYMDEGGIYEEGTPDEIFDNPKRDKTRDFIQRILHFDRDIDIDDVDFLSISSLLLKFAMDNEIDFRRKNRMSIVVEEMLMGYLIKEKQSIRNLQLHILYIEKEERIQIQFEYDGDYIFIPNEDDIESMLLSGYTESIHTEELDNNHKIMQMQLRNE